VDETRSPSQGAVSVIFYLTRTFCALLHFTHPLQIDSSVSITSVGVDKFILTQRGSLAGNGSEDIVLLRVTIPQSSIALRACEAVGGDAPSLLLTCYLPNSPGAKESFSVQLEGGGSALPTTGLAPPSFQVAAAMLDPGSGRLVL